VEILVIMNVIFLYVILEEMDSLDYLQALETYLQSSSNVVVKQQQEINELQTLCRTLKRVCDLYILCARICRWEDNIKMDLREVGCGGADWVDLAQDRDRWRAVVYTVMNLRVP
jgi:hypothetical protein